MVDKLLLESSGTPEKAGKGRYLVAIATPGQGSSGFYAESMLEEFGPKAFPKGAKCFENHEASRKPTDMIGTFPEGAYWDPERKQLMGELEVFPHWQDFMESVAPHCGISIYMAGKADKEGNVTELVLDRQNGADLVSYEGLEGSKVVEMLESARAAGSEPGVTAAQESNRKDASDMDEATAQKLIAAIEALLARDTQAAVEAAQVEADETLATERVKHVLAANEAIDKADISKRQAAALREQAATGADITALIKEAEETRAAILEESGVDREGVAGRIAGASTGSSLSIGAWSN